MSLKWYAKGLIGPNLASVSSEVIDGEAIIMHHDIGVYFNCVGSGAAIWQAVSATLSLDEIVEYMTKCYSGERDKLTADVTRFLDLLNDNNLIEPAADDLRRPVPLATAGEVYREPVLEVHNDLADLLLLDPVHVGPMASWPSPKGT